MEAAGVVIGKSGGFSHFVDGASQLLLPNELRANSEFPHVYSPPHESTQFVENNGGGGQPVLIRRGGGTKLPVSD